MGIGRRIRTSLIAAALGVAVLAVVAAGCGGSKPEAKPAAAAGSVPASAALAPGDALGFVTLVSDENTPQWQNADRFWRLFPDAHAALFEEIQSELAADGLAWKTDVAPALGTEVVVVVTADRRPIVLTQPDDKTALARLLELSDEKPVTGEVQGWTAIAESQQDLSAYQAAVERSSLAGVESFTSTMTTLPADSLMRMWVDINAIMGELGPLLEQAGTEATDLKLESMGVALGAEQTGLRFTLGMKMPESVSSGTTYEPKLLGRVPADAVVALSFGGSQGAFNQAKETLNLDEIANELENAIGVSVDQVFDALSGEGMIYVRPPAAGADIPEVTIALAPPNADEAFETVESLMGAVADEVGEVVETTTEGQVNVSRLVIQGVEVRYAQIEDVVIITTGAAAITEFVGDNAKLGTSAAFLRASEQVSLADSTQGFAYVDLDGLIPLIEGLAGPETLPSDARAVLSELDSFIMQGSSSDGLTQMTGFLRTVR